jgi:hypothetical protein
MEAARTRTRVSFPPRLLPVAFESRMRRRANGHD